MCGDGRHGPFWRIPPWRLEDPDMPAAVLRQGDIALGALFAARLAAGVAQVLLMGELMVVA